MNNLLSLTGINEAYASEMTNELNSLLANFQVFYQNTRGFHWNIKGEKFFLLHEKFEELYDDLNDKVDEIAERIIMLGGLPLHTFPDYLQAAQIEVVKNVTDAKSCVSSILASFKYLLSQERTVLAKSAEHNDEATVSLMSDYIKEQEKLVWMYNAFLNN